MKILVTGGAGYIGSVLTGRLLELGHKVTMVDNFRHGYHGILHLVRNPNLEVINRNILDPNRDYLKNKDFIFHLAALTSNAACEANKDEARQVNGALPWNIMLINYPEILDIPFLYTSTTAIYGDRKGAIVDKGIDLSLFTSTYSKTKLIGEQHLEYNEKAIILRLGTVYGVSPLMRPNALVNDFVRSAVQDGIIVVYGADTFRPYLHIQDCVNGLISAMNEAENLFGNAYDFFHSNYQKATMAYIIQSLTDCEVLISDHTEEFPQNFRLEHDLKLPVRFEKTFEMGIKELIKLYSFYD
jgi:nucleoside-diphosphate-sugar epimerase